MLTKSAKNILSCYSNSNIIPMHNQTGSASVALIEVKTIGGSTCYVAEYASGSAISIISASLVESGSYASYGVAFGSGGTQPTENDVAIENLITGLTASSPSTTYLNTDKYVVRLDYTIQNDTGQEVIIREVCRFCSMPTASQKGNTVGSNASKRCIMMDRTLLQTPVTIPTGQAAIVRYEFSYS